MEGAHGTEGSSPHGLGCIEDQVRNPFLKCVWALVSLVAGNTLRGCGVFRRASVAEVGH